MKNWDVIINGVWMGCYQARSFDMAFMAYCHDYGFSTDFFRKNYPDATIAIKKV